MSAEHDSRIPEELQGRLHLVRVLSRGTGGEVYLCRDSELGRLAVLKLSVVQEEDPQLVRRFQREAKILSRIEHPQVVRLLDAGKLGNSRWLLFEHLEGQDFNEVLKDRGSIEWREALQYARSMADGLAELHANEVLHRDIKPANVMLHKGRGPVLIDFGIAAGRVDPTAITRTGMLVGTPEFLAPERILQGRATPASDVYSVGVFLIMMISGKSPFQRAELLDTLEAQVNEPPPRLVGVPHEVQDLIDLVVSKVEVDRPADGAALSAAIDRVLEGSAPEIAAPTWQVARRLGRGTPASPPAAPAPAPAASRLPGGGTMAGMVLAFFALGLAAGFALRDPAPPAPSASPASSPSPSVTSLTSDPLDELEKHLASRLHHQTLTQLLAESSPSPECRRFLRELEDWVDSHATELGVTLAGGEGLPEESRTHTYEKLRALANVSELLPDATPLRRKVHALRSRYVSIESSPLTTDPVPDGDFVHFPRRGAREVYLAPWGLSRAACVAALRKVMSSEPRVEEVLSFTMEPRAWRGREWVELTVSTRCLARGLSISLDLGGTRRIDLWGIGPPLSLDLFARLDVVLGEGGKASPWQVYRVRLPGAWIGQAGGRVQLKVYSALARPGAAMTFVPSVWLITSQ